MSLGSNVGKVLLFAVLCFGVVVCAMPVKASTYESFWVKDSSGVGIEHAKVVFADSWGFTNASGYLYLGIDISHLYDTVIVTVTEPSPYGVYYNFSSYVNVATMDNPYNVTLNNVGGGSPPDDPADVDWAFYSATGYWEVWNRTQWQTHVVHTFGSMNYSRYVGNCTGYTVSINFTDFAMVRGDWWWLLSDKQFYYTLEVRQAGTNRNFVVPLYFHEITNTWSLIRDRLVVAGFKENGTDPYDCSNSKSRYFDLYNFMAELNYVRMDIYRKVDDTGVLTNDFQVNVAYYAEDGAIVNLVSQTISETADFCGDVQLFLYIRHSGQGHLAGGCTDVLYNGTVYNPSLPAQSEPQSIGFFAQLQHDIWSITSNALPSWMTNYLSEFGVWGGMILSILGVIWGALVAMLPYLPFILLFYLIDVVVSSIHQGSFQPIGEFATGLYGLGTGAVHTVVSIASAIWSFIHFW